MNKPLIMFLSLFLSSVAIAQGGLPKEAIKKGSLGNQILINDTMQPAMVQAAVMGCDHLTKDVEFFTVQMPKGKEGSRNWKEIWRFNCKSGKYLVKITFQETGNGVSFTVSQ